jgi:hypothetical protein
VTLLEANVDKMPLFNLLECVGKELVSVQLGYIANGKWRGFVATPGLEGLSVLYFICFCFVCLV